MNRRNHYLFPIILLLLATGCKKLDPDEQINIDYRQEMRDFVINMSVYAKTINSDFLIIPQNGQELITDSGEGSGSPETDYLRAFDATGRESMFFGYDRDNKETPSEDRKHMLELCLLCEQFNVEVLTTDCCSTQSKMDNSYQINEDNGFISFAADERELNNIPNYPVGPYNENSNDIEHISQAKNFLYLINSEEYGSKQDFINSLTETNYDLLIMDLYHNEASYTSAEIEALQSKQNGGNRLVVCYMSIGEAEDYRYYWQENWDNEKPSWMEPENPNWKGNYKVKYWEPEWQNIVFGNESSYLKKILDLGFDGVYLDIIDGFEYFEEK